jgi:hypothetical protein
LAEPLAASAATAPCEEGADLARLRDERDAALAASGARASFLATMSHEIREPMSGVLGMARLLRDTPLDAEQRGYVEAVVDSAETLLTLINDILDLSRVDAGRLELGLTDVSLAPFLARFRAALEPRARVKGLTLDVWVAPGTPEVLRTDPGRLRQVLTNLVGNAIKFTERGGVTGPRRAGRRARGQGGPGGRGRRHRARHPGGRPAGAVRELRAGRRRGGPALRRQRARARDRRTAEQGARREPRRPQRRGARDHLHRRAGAPAGPPLARRAGAPTTGRPASPARRS